jgi:hypothetical protein
MIGTFSKSEFDYHDREQWPEWDGGYTKDVVWQIIIWSLLAVETGLFPFLDWRGEAITDPFWLALAGTQIAGGYCGVMWLFKSDAEYHHVYMNLPGHWSSHYPCATCQAENIIAKGPSDPMHHLNLAATNTWPDTMMLSMVTYFAWCTAREKPVHLLLRPRSEGGMGLHLMVFFKDALHCVDLGTCPHTLGSTLWLLCYTDMLFVGEPLKAITQAAHEVSEIYSRDHTSTQFNGLSLDLLTDPGSPLGGTAFLGGKAAENRHLAPVVLEVWNKHKRATGFDMHVALTLQSLCEVYAKLDHRDELNRVPVDFAPAACAEFRNDIESFLTHYMYLRSVAEANEWPIFHAVSKFHSMWHMGFEAQCIHLALARVYANEDFVGKSTVVGFSVRHAVPAAARSTAVTEKFALGRCLDLHFS